MKEFMDKDFLLSTDTARKLYKAARDMPIFDYHCHLSPREIYENIQFRNIGHLMLGGDHYKWRAMRANGAPEALCCAAGDDWEKFLAFAGTLKYAIGNPLYHWTHLELRRVFGITDVLTEKSAKVIWDKANAMLQTDDFRCRRLIEKFNVKVICTTDDPCDDLHYHKLLAQDRSFKVRVLPAFRPDKAVRIEDPGFVQYVTQLGRLTGQGALNLQDMLASLEARVAYFHEVGARVSDHGLDTVPYAEPDYALAQEAYRKALSGEALSPLERDTYKTCVLRSLGRMYAARGWVMQYHIGALRNNNTRMLQRLGADVGCDSSADAPVAANLARLLDVLERENALPKTILYCLNPRENYTLATMTGNFQTGGVPGKIQFGAGWWFADQKPGMIDQMTALATQGLLGRFVGMLTDSRSFISYTRHEYFRHILCDMIGRWVEEGEYPADMDTLKQLVRGICYENAVEYFGIDVR